MLGATTSTGLDRSVASHAYIRDTLHTSYCYKCVSMQEFKIHSDETDSERIQQIIDRAVTDAQWVTKKVYVQPPLLHSL